MPNQNHSVEKVLDALKKDFIVVGKTRVRSWHAWLAIGLCAGILAGILFVANRSGEFEVGMAAISASPTGYLDGIDTSGNANGWTLDPDAPSQSIDVHFYIDGTASANFAGYTKADILRQDVNDVLKVTGNHGFDFSIPSKYRDGKQHTLYTFAIDTSGGSNPQLPDATNGQLTKSFSITVPLNNKPIGYLEGVDQNGNASGWALDPDVPSQSIDTHFYIDGTASANFAGAVKAAISRPDVNKALTTAELNVTGNHGFNFPIPEKYRDGKQHILYTFAINTAGGTNPQLPDATNGLLTKSFIITVPLNNKPTGYLNAEPLSSGFAGGWALDPDVSSQFIDVHFYIDGTASANFAGAVKAAIPRPDVNQVTKYPGDHGFNFPIPAKYRDGKQHTLYAYAIDTAGGTNPPLLDATTGLPTKSFVVNPPVIGLPWPPLPVGYQAGWDYNLTKRCVKSVDATVVNYYKDTSDCVGQAKKWTVAAESEKELGISTVGPVNQSFPINAPGSPLSMQWVPHIDELGRKNYSVNLKTDFANITHPGGAGEWTWFVLMDHVGHNGGPLPGPYNITTRATIGYNDFTPNGASRGFIAWQGWWDGKSHAIEINFALTNWGDAHSDADIVKAWNQSDPVPGYEDYVVMDGRAMGIFVTKGVTKKIEVDWFKIIQNLVSRGFMKAPSNGWLNPTTVTHAVFIGTETHGWTAKESVIADLWLTDFRIESKVPFNHQPIGYLGDFDQSGNIGGWTLDPDAPSQSIDAHFYIDGTASINYAGVVKAAIPRPDVNQVTKYPGDHGFNFLIPTKYRDGKPHTLYAYGIDTAGGTNPPLLDAVTGLPTKSFTINPSVSTKEVWFVPNIFSVPDHLNRTSPSDYQTFWNDEALLQSVFQKSAVFGFYGGSLSPSGVSDLNLQKAIPILKKYNIKTSLEIAGVKGWDSYFCAMKLAGETGAALDLATIKKIYDAGGKVDYLAMDDPIARIIANGDYGTNCGYNIADSVKEVIDSMQKIHSAYPDIKIGLIYNFPNRRYGGIAPYWGPSWPYYNIADYKTVTDALFTKAASVGEHIDFIHVDSGYDYSTGIAPIPYADFDPKSVDWIKRIIDLEKQVKLYQAKFGIIINTEKGMNQSNGLFKTYSLAFMDLYKIKGGSPDNFVLESWGNYPNQLLPDTTVNTFMNTAVEVIKRASGLQSPDATKPSVPTGLSASVISSSQINLSWNVSTDNAGGLGISGYKIFRNGVQIADVNTNSYQNIGLAPSTAYSYTVAAYDAVGNTSIPSSVAQASTLANQSPLGWIDLVDGSGNVIGWALDPDDPSKSIRVDFYVYPSATGQWTFAGYVATANIPRPDVNNATGYFGNHGFSFSISNSFRDGKANAINAYGIETSGTAGPNPLLLGSPKEFTLP
ncbi:MAG: fibronectin type III domain-containing protein [bacterium]|nr:fibronectin type III domain-containing protein [bacterium]